MLFNHKVWSQEEILTKAQFDTKEWLDETKTLTSNETHLTFHNALKKMKWTKPKDDWIKYNYDVSHHTGNHQSGMGWIMRNAYRTLKHYGMDKFQGRTTVEEAECSALIWNLQVAWGLGYKKVEFESDN